MNTEKLDAERFYFIAETNTNKYVHYTPSFIDTEDVIQDLVIDLWEKYRAGKFTTEEEAWVICRNKIIDFFREWGSVETTKFQFVSLDELIDKELAGLSAEDALYVDEDGNYIESFADEEDGPGDDYDDVKYMDKQFWVDIMEGDLQCQE